MFLIIDILRIPNEIAWLGIPQNLMCDMSSIGSGDGLTHSPPWQNGRRFADNIFRCIFMNEKFCILIKISLKFVPKDPIDNNSALD